MRESRGILLVDKPAGITSFRLVSQLRRLTGVRKIGHAGTLDPFATGVMVMLIGRDYTRLSDTLLHHDKQYTATLALGASTNTYDLDGEITERSPFRPPLSLVEEAIARFQGETYQTPPSFSAKKVGGRKLCDLARKGIEVERGAALVRMSIDLLSFEQDQIVLDVSCSKGTYIRSLAHDLGEHLGCGAHLSALRRTRSGPFTIDQCLDGALFNQSELDLEPYLLNEMPCSV